MAKPAETDIEVRRERGMTVVVIGWLLWGFALLYLFFRPAEIRRGGTGILYAVLALGALGLLLNIIGWRMKRRALK
ncbi:MAG TPA: hypothetical protein VMT82_03705 [candidate division Zixibacteria bacterium]|nr:hypothetical protein [candidate division Zixibacteria bacterium]